MTGLSQRMRQDLRQALRDAGRPPQQRIAFDGHFGNFIVGGVGEALLVDLEQCRYSNTGLEPGQDPAQDPALDRALAA